MKIFMHPEVTVIIPCFNYGHLLAETLTSVAAQTLTNWECIIVDDGSTDNTKEVALAFVDNHQRFKYIFQQNSGLSAARNTGIRAASGEFLQFLDADDLIEPRKFEEQVRCFKEYPDTDIVYGDVRYFSTEYPQERLYSIWGYNLPWMPKVSGRGKSILKNLVIANMMVVNSPLVRRNVFDTCGLFDESLKSNEDWDYWLRCALQNKVFHFLDSIGTLALVRYHAGSMSCSRITMYETKLMIHEKLFSTLSDVELRRINRQAWRQTGFSLFEEFIRNGNRSAAWRCLLKYTSAVSTFNLFCQGMKVLLLDIMRSRQEQSL